MRSIVLVALAAPFLVAACATTPLQKCEAPYRAELRTVTEEMRRTELLLRRGYDLVPARFEFGVHHCIRPSGMVYVCTARDGEPMYDKRPINRPAERAKLSALAAEADRLKAGLAACRARYPQEAAL